jgi:predicted protein tyrosine phosphatase
VEADEQGRIEALSRSPSVLVARVRAKDAEGRLCDVRTEEIACCPAQSEEQAARAQGLGYLRIPVSDHSRPQDQDVDRFIAFVRDLAPETWLHFHCHAGDGRTTTFLLLYDMLQNAQALGLEELAARQHLLGGVDLLHSPSPVAWKEPLSRERAAFLSQFHRYARQGIFETVSWSQYLARS